MSEARTSSDSNRRWRDVYRWVRQLHIWIGAWGALAAVLYGSTGLIMNHRFGDNAWPQGESNDIGKSELMVPAQARTSAEVLSLWLRDTHSLDADIIRKPKSEDAKRSEDKSGRKKSGNGKPDESKDAPRWTFSGGTARESWSVEYVLGSNSAKLKRTRHSPLAILNRLHKTVGGGAGWRLLADSFAVGMILLGLSGLWLWGRGRSLKKMLLSVFAVSVLVMAVVLIPNLL